MNLGVDLRVSDWGERREGVRVEDWIRVQSHGDIVPCSGFHILIRTPGSSPYTLLDNSLKFGENGGLH